VTPHDIVKSYIERNFQVVFWPQIGDVKGPKEKDWQHKPKTLTDYREGLRVGLLTGIEAGHGHYLHDVDIDWEPGASIAQRLLPATGFIFGRASKRISHCFYTLPEALPSYRYEDLDKTCLIELRGTKSNGDIGYQTMAPPSVWTKEGKSEPLAFVTHDSPAHLTQASQLKQRVCLAAIGMLLAKHFGINGFGHEAHLCVAGFLLRAGIPEDDVIAIGEAISPITNNLEIVDIRRTVQSTAASLANPKAKVKGGPALARLLGLPGKAVIARINEWLGRDSDFIRDQDGRILAKHQGNIRRAIELLGHDLSYNEFSDKLLLDHKPLEDPQWKALYLEIEGEYRFQPPVDYFKIVIEVTAVQNNFHPVKQYLDALTWDGKPRLDTWLIRCAGVEDTEYVRAVSSILLIAAVRRIRQPGAKYDEMVVLESEQGLNKSSALRALCPNESWFSDDLRLNLHAQQLIEATLGKWIIEASDLAGKRKTEIEQLKAMLSRQVDGPARMAYAHFAVERPRHFIIIGTTNSKAYLTDSTGARRFWPIAVQRFDVDLIRKHRDQMWAEACVREARGDAIRLPEALWPAATEQQEQRREMDPWEETIRDLLMNVATDSGGRRRVSTIDLWNSLAIPLERRDRAAAIRVSEIMQRLGFRRCTVRNGDTVQAGYVTLDHNRLFLSDLNGVS